MDFFGYDSQTQLLILADLAVAFYNSWFVTLLKILLGIYTLVLVADLVMLFILQGFSANFRIGLRGVDMPLTSPSKMAKRWSRVKDRLKSGSESQFKVAILEADAIADEILQGVGYPGANMTERLSQLSTSQLDNLEELLAAHQVRNRIIHDETFSLDHKTTEEVIEVYEKFLKYYEFL